MEWGQVLESKEMGRHQSSVDRPNGLGSYDYEDSDLWDGFPYSSEELEEVVSNNYIPDYEQEAENLIEYLEEEFDTETAEAAAAVKVGVHLTGYNVPYREIKKLQNCDKNPRTIQRRADKIKNEIGLDDSFDWRVLTD